MELYGNVYKSDVTGWNWCIGDHDKEKILWSGVGPNKWACSKAMCDTMGKQIPVKDAVYRESFCRPGKMAQISVWRENRTVYGGCVFIDGFDGCFETVSVSQKPYKTVRDAIAALRDAARELVY